MCRNHRPSRCHNIDTEQTNQGTNDCCLCSLTYLLLNRIHGSFVVTRIQVIVALQLCGQMLFQQVSSLIVRESHPNEQRQLHQQHSDDQNHVLEREKGRSPRALGKGECTNENETCPRLLSCATVSEEANEKNEDADDDQ